MGNYDGPSRDLVVNAAHYTAGAAYGAEAQARQNARNKGWPNPNSRVAHALEKKGCYIPVRLTEELNDAMLALSIDKGVHFTDQNYQQLILRAKQSNPPSYSLQIVVPNLGSLHMPVETGNLEKELVSSIEESINNRDMQDRVKFEHKQYDHDYVLFVDSINLDDVLKIIADDFINKNYPDYKVDYKKIIREESPTRQIVVR